MIKKIHIENYKIFESFDIELNDEMNIIVGDNEQGKSTILEAVYLALTKRLNGRSVEFELTPYLFNSLCVDHYFKELEDGKNPELPSIIIELYLDDSQELAFLRGSMNSKREDCIGVKLEIVFNDDYIEEYQNLLKNNEIKLIPAEYFTVHWRGFDNNGITLRRLPVRASYIDATTIRLQSGTDFYLQDIIKTDLDPKERVELNIAYRNLKEAFSNQQSIKDINQRLTSKKGAITEKDLSIAIDISQRSNWETNLVPHLDKLPFQFIGKGEQSALKIMLALERKVENSNVILIEEPENHLSFTRMNTLVNKVKEKCAGKQIITTTHSAYVLNKLGLEHLILIHDNNVMTLKDLSADTQNYFKKLSGYDTLRLILAKKAILVEGPSDELIVQKTFYDKYESLPIDAGVDVINVRGLSFKRFLDIARLLEKDVRVVTDNDGNYQAVIKKYKDYDSCPTIGIYFSDDDSLNTLEPQLVGVNGLEKMNRILGKSFGNESELLDFMVNNKTECALRMFESGEKITIPTYLENAIDFQ